MPIRAQLHITGLGVNRATIIEEGIVRIGSDPVCEIQLDHGLLSPLHAQIERVGDAVTLSDLDSLRGTKLNGVWVEVGEPRTLKTGDEILVHPFRLSYTEVQVDDSRQAAQDMFDVMQASTGMGDLQGTAPDEPAKPRVPSDNLPPSVLAQRVIHRENVLTPPGLDMRSVRYLEYLPAIYHNDFTSRFLGMLEATLLPIEWTIANFDLFLSPQTAPDEFLPWLGGWYNLTLDSSWTDAQRRTFIAEAQMIYAMRGTKWALTRTLEIYLGRKPEIIDLEDKENPFLFTVKLPFRKQDVNTTLIERIIEENKPVQATYKLKFERRMRAKTVWDKLDL